jgi:hypothetical protein
MKVRLIASTADADLIIDAASSSADKALAQLRSLPSEAEGLKALWSMKVQRTGCDPLNSEVPLNLIEQLNQTFTYIASARAAKLLLSLHPESAPFTLSLGTASGHDIQSDRGEGVAAEVFAAVSTASNRKLVKDTERIRRSSARFKYVFFMCPGYVEGRQRQLEKHPDVEIWSVGATI